MKIMVCETCGKFIHRAERCCHCGGTGMYPAEYQKKLHHAGAKDYAEMDRLLAARAFDQVLTLSDRVLEWMGFTSDVYWMRLLASHGCADDRELIVSGAALDSDGDYYNAVKYAEPEEHQAYLDIRDKAEAVRSEVIALLRERFRQEKQTLDLSGAQKNLEGKITGIRRELTELWKQMCTVEARIHALEADWDGAAAPHRAALARAREEAEAVRQRSGFAKCGEGEFLTCQLRLAAALELSESASQTLDAMTAEHPWAQEYQSLAAQRDGIEEKIQEKLGTLDDCLKAAEQTLQELENRNRQEREQLQAVENGSYTQARKLLGEEAFAGALRRAGVV